MDLNDIPPVTPIEQEVDPSVDYSKMTWQEVIKYIKTPKQAQDYINRHIKYCYEEELEPFKEEHEDGEATCEGHALIPSALLSDNGYACNYTTLHDDGNPIGHAIYIYRTKKGYGILGTTPLPSKFKTIDDLMNRLNSAYSGFDYDGYMSFDLDKIFPNRSWITGDKISFPIMIKSYIRIKKEKLN